MGNVIPFPGKAVNTKLQMTNALWNKVDELEEKYQALDKIHQILNEVEQEVAELEKDYDATLEEYANNVGADNISVGLLQYSAKAIVEVLPEEGSITIRWGEGKPQTMILEDDYEN